MFFHLYFAWDRITKIVKTYPGENLIAIILAVGRKNIFADL